MHITSKSFTVKQQQTLLAVIKGKPKFHRFDIINDFGLISLVFYVFNKLYIEETEEEKNARLSSMS